MPGLFVFLSLAAFAAMVATGALSKTPSPGAPQKLPALPPASVPKSLLSAAQEAVKGLPVGKGVLFTYQGGTYGANLSQNVAGAPPVVRYGPIIKPKESWLLTFDVVVLPGTSFDKATFEQTLKSAMATSADVQSFNWIGSAMTAQIAFVAKTEIEGLVIGNPTIIKDAGSVTVTDALRVPAVV